VTEKLERRRREWRVELREAAIERKALKERIELLERRAEKREEEHRCALADARDLFEKTFRALERKIREANDLANEADRLRSALEDKNK
jgi:uncharacterized protein Yka (UPF0111/DUF47 family)